MLASRISSVALASVALIATVTGCASAPESPTTTAQAKIAGSATSTVLTPNGVAVDGAGNVYIADYAKRVIDKVTPSGLSIVAGIPGPGGTVAPGSAISSPLSNPTGLAVDAAGDLYFSDSGTSQIVGEVSASTHNLAVVAGMIGDGGPIVPGPATQSQLLSPGGVAVDAAGDLYIADTLHGVVEKVDTTGALSIVAGIANTFGVPTPGPAVASRLYAPSGVAVDKDGNLYIADEGNKLVEKVDPAGTLSIFAGIAGSGGTPNPNPGPADATSIGDVTGVAVDSAGDLFIADTSNAMVYEVTADDTLSIVAGDGASGAPSAGAATSSHLGSPGQVAVAPDGTLYIGDTSNNVVEKVSNGTLSIFAGTGKSTAMANIQLAAASAISQRTGAVESLMPAVNNATWLTDADKSVALAGLQSELDGLLAIGKSLTTDTTTTQARTDYRAIFIQFRIFYLALQQVHLAAAADDLTEGVLPNLTAAYNQLEALLTGVDSGQATPAIKALMADVQTQISTITTHTNGLAATVLAYTPAQWNQNPSLLKPAKASINAATVAANKAGKDIAAVESALGTTTTPATKQALAAVQTHEVIVGSVADVAAKDLTTVNSEQAQDDQPKNLPTS